MNAALIFRLAVALTRGAVRVTVPFNAVLTRPRRRHGHRVKLRPVVTYEADLEVEVDYTPGMPGRFSGPPESCYPDEPDDVEVLEARNAGTGRAVAWTPTRAQRTELEGLARESFEDACGDGPDAEYDGPW